MSRRKQVNASFWVSYSDLATGLMIVFMVVMLLMVALSMRQEKSRTDNYRVQQDRVRDLVDQIQIILGVRRDVAKAIEDAVKKLENREGIRVDPVTAQLTIPEELIGFTRGSAALSPPVARFLNGFAPTYFCQLMRHEERDCPGGCEDLDPTRAQGIRRVLITGHGDLSGRSADTVEIAHQRARNVAVHVRGLLERCARSNCTDDGYQPPVACVDRMDDLWRYAEKRIWAASAGNVEHCVEQTFRDAGGAGRVCDDKELNQEGPAFRRVDFSLELTGDDMTGLLVDVLSLQASVGLDASDDLEALAGEVRIACEKNRGAYHGCEKVLESKPEVRAEP